MTPQDEQTISLGFTAQPFPPGVHICQIFGDDDERQDALLKFVLSGLQTGERTCCFSEKMKESILAGFLESYGVSYHDAVASAALTLAGTREIYFQNNCFNPERMLDMIKETHQDSVRRGYRAARVIGEMTSEIQHVPGGARLLEYESRISLLLRQYPVTAVCQYDSRAFEGSTIMDILKVHPLMVVRNAVVRNPFFIPPEDFLSQMPQ